jgi:hypothetical protein
VFRLWEALVVLGEVEIRALCLLGVLVEDGTDVVEETVYVFRGFGLYG